MKYYFPTRAIGEVSVASMSNNPTDEMIMTTTTFDIGHTTESGDTARSGFWSRLARSFIAAREAEARRRIAVHFASLNDHQLAALGLSAREIEMHRAGPAARVDFAA